MAAEMRRRGGLFSWVLPRQSSFAKAGPLCVSGAAFPALAIVFSPGSNSSPAPEGDLQPLLQSAQVCAARKSERRGEEEKPQAVNQLDSCGVALCG